MKLRQWLEEWGLTGLKLTVPFLEAEWKPQAPDQDAAWELYVELLTRITTQPLADEHGDEKTALDSVYSLFGVTREILKRHGKYGTTFAKIAIPVLNQVVRPFTAKWHRLSLQNAFADQARCAEFRRELLDLQAVLRRYTKALSSMAGVEDLTTLEAVE
jgi:hypothetical protein